MSADVDALNYPYIRIRDVDWLKRTLLIFPHVVRMTPILRAPVDDAEIETFCDTEGLRGPLLRSADLWASHVRAAQYELIDQLKALGCESNVLKNLGPRKLLDRIPRPIMKDQTVWDSRLAPNSTFQIHREKMLHPLIEFLLDEGLAWRPRERYSHGPDYVEMNPQLGEAIMATLAVACAENEGLHVVTEFPKLHGNLIGVPRDEILKQCLGNSENPGGTSAQQIAEFLVYRRCDVTALTAERIAALKSERDALAAFRAKLEELSETLPPTICSEVTLKERLDDLLNDIFREWQRDQVNLSNYSRRLFGEGVLDEPGKLAQKLVEKAFESKEAQAVGAASAAGVLGAHIGGLTISAATAAASGFVVALVFRAIGVWGETKKAARESPFRYLTALEEHGVSFSLAR